MKTSQSCPKVILRSDASFLGMKHRVWQEKLMYTVKEVGRKEPGQTNIPGAERATCSEQGWPGLAQEVSDICSEIGLEDLNDSDIPKEKVQEKIFYHHYKEMNGDMSGMTKLEDKKN